MTIQFTALITVYLSIPVYVRQAHLYTRYQYPCSSD